MPIETSGRRPLKTRDWPFFKNLAAWLARSGATPNGISFMSIVFGCLAGASLAATSHLGGWAVRACWLGAAVCIQLRLIANLLDGMVAVEGRKGGPVGDLWNEAPDRVSDAAIFIGAGYALGSAPVLGYGAALVAVFVAYIRALGASVGVGQIFLGPQAKQQRMAVTTVACVLSAVFPWTAWGMMAGGPLFTIIEAGLVVIIVGGVFTAWRRLARLAALLREKAH
ncbi:MAG: CDP-alcohol phosphatidyltransferase family protein [Chthoniobacter sp.]|uniref:CDP-alcohol phosphatidyltransferase family protein n=1 Tax=Chthoniobacter sp. TaxID=2510640 RepID=UPI0032ABB8AA